MSFNTPFVFRRFSRPRFWFLILFLQLMAGTRLDGIQIDFEGPPIRYSKSTPNNLVETLQKKLDQKKVEFHLDADFGYLKSTLDALDISPSTQMLTFLKSSMQRPLIGPQSPRAIYFSDDAYVGFVRGGILELIVSDPKLGLVFYTLDANPSAARFHRQVSRCMTCHSSSRTRNIPGMQVRSMLTDPTGLPVLSAGSTRTDHSTPMSKRWGGWYVTGTHGESTHLGNFQLPSKKRPKKPVDNAAGVNLTELPAFLQSQQYLTPHSDLVALMVFEHQIDAHNLMARTLYAYRHNEHLPNGQQDDGGWKREADGLAGHLLFEGEPPLQWPIQGTSTFVDDFASRGPSDTSGRSLREFDLQERLFKYPCSYMIYSRLFREMPVEVRSHIRSRLLARLLPADTLSDNRKLRGITDKVLEETREILRETFPD